MSVGLVFPIHTSKQKGWKDEYQNPLILKSQKNLILEQLLEPPMHVTKPVQLFQDNLSLLLATKCSANVYF